jgi:hypothetical protein
MIVSKISCAKPSTCARPRAVPTAAAGTRPTQQRQRHAAEDDERRRPAARGGTLQVQMEAVERRHDRDDDNRRGQLPSAGLVRAHRCFPERRKRRTVNGKNPKNANQLHLARVNALSPASAREVPQQRISCWKKHHSRPKMLQHLPFRVVNERRLCPNSY